MAWERHYINEMDDEKVQRCIYCWKPICDLRGTIMADGSPPLKGYPAGEIYVREGQPKITQISEPGESEIVVDCTITNN